MAGPDGDQAVQSVTIDGAVAALLGIHGLTYPTTSVHGILVGKKTSSTTVHVTDAYPVCHETPTRTVVDLAISLVASKVEEDGEEKKEIIGWYTAPEILEDSAPGPVALRIAANIASASASPTVLVVLNNSGLVELVAGGESCTSFLSAFGKDFGGQWMENIKDVKVQDDEKAVGGIRKGVTATKGEGGSVKDLTDHWQSGASSEWTTSSNLEKYF